MRAAPLLPLLLVVAWGAVACRATPTPRWDPAAGSAGPARVNLRLKGKAQERSLSCESRSACDLLAHYGRPMGEDAFRLGLPVSDNPDLGFVGDVDGPGEQLPPSGYGVHAEPLAARLRAVGLPVRAERGRGLAWLQTQLATGRPVIVWATGMLDAPQPVAMRDARGRAFVVARGEHTFLAVGYEPGRILLVDSATGREKAVPARRFDASWAVLGRQAVVPDAPPATGR
ncbi:MAG: C39 family peptidase [Planctomycetota bacterium]|nr:C39 family peptidase [Planctomycetota bacterium]